MVRKGSWVQIPVVAPILNSNLSMKRLYRSRTDKVIGGVCGGLAKYTDSDPVIWRIAALILALPGGPSILIYLICWLVIPLEPETTDTNTKA